MQGVTRDALAEALWPAGLPPTWRSSLRTVVSRVRASFLAEHQGEWIEGLAGIDDKTALPHEVRHWREHVEGEFRAVTLTGAHFFLHGQPPAVAEVIRRAMVG